MIDGEKMIRKRKRKLQKKLIIITSISLLFVMTVGYAAFQTNLTINAKGKIINKTITINMKGINVPVVTEEDGLYEDTYEEGRYVYKGANPNNYITFNNETWRIISVETDGTLKIIKNSQESNHFFDESGYRDSTSNGAGGTYCAKNSFGCNAWAINNNFVSGNNSGTVLKDASLNVYLNETYYNKLSSEAKGLIQKHDWSIGAVQNDNTDLAAQIKSENTIKWNGNIALLSISDFLKANTNTEQCENYKIYNENATTCRTTNYIFSIVGSGTNVFSWLISPSSTNTFHTGILDGNRGRIAFFTAYSGIPKNIPSVYLISNITLSGEGTKSNPYTIVS